MMYPQPQTPKEKKSRLFERDEPWRVGGTDTGTTVLNGFAKNS